MRSLASPFVEQEIAIPAGPGSPASLFGTLTLPEGHPRGPGALIIPGSGPTDRDGNSHLGHHDVAGNNSLSMLARTLAGHGVASVRIDKRGVGKSASALRSEEELRFIGNVDDALLWLDALGAVPRIDRLFIIGHSEGATVATMAARRRSVDGLVLIAGPGERAGEGLRRQIGRTSPPPCLIDEIERALTRLEAGQPVPELRVELAPLFRSSVQPYLISWFAIDPARELAGVTVPTLIVQGTRDLQVTVQDAERLSAGRPGTKLVLVDGMNHVMKIVGEDEASNTSAYSDPNLPIAPALVHAVSDFILRDVA